MSLLDSIFTDKKETANVKPVFETIGTTDDKSKEQFHKDKQQEASTTREQGTETKRGRGRPPGSGNKNKGENNLDSVKPVDATLFISGTRIILKGISNGVSKVIGKKAEKVVSKSEAQEYAEDAKIIDEELEMTAIQLGTLAAQSQALAMYGPYLLAIGGIASWGVRVSALNATLSAMIEEQKKKPTGTIATPPQV